MPTPAIVPSAVRPAAPASQRLRHRAARRSLSLNGFGLAVSPGDAPPGAGHHLVVDGAEQIGPVLGGGFACGAGPEQDRLIPLDHVDPPRTKIDDELVHANP